MPQPRESRRKCSYFVCQKPHVGKYCPQCRGRDDRETAFYCDKPCQSKDWKFHKKFCGKNAYTFHIELLGSKDPVITRVVEVPSWYTFKEFHSVIQYAFGPWQNSHLHEFLIPEGRQPPPNRGGTVELIMRSTAMTIGSDDLFQDEGFLGGNQAKVHEQKVNLSDFYESSGKFHHLLLLNGAVQPIRYLYDFGDNWEHLVTFKRKKLANSGRPVFRKAIGKGPVEDCGGPTGWQEVKQAFRNARPSREQLSQREWARNASGEGDSYDPLAQPDIVQMNYEGRWENHFESYMGDDYKPLYTPYQSDDEFDGLFDDEDEDDHLLEA